MPGEGLPPPEAAMTATVLRWQDGGCRVEAEVMRLKIGKRGTTRAEKGKTMIVRTKKLFYYF